jgi:glyoxylase-like metal-dependent hydrolase (beta-lactamase superfamily II)
MATTTEIAPDVFRISIFAPFGDLQFNHFLIRDEEPLLFHTGLRGMFPEVREAVSKLIRVEDLRHISFSHFESDECGALNEWLAVARKADVVCSQVGAIVTVNDFIGREARAVTEETSFPRENIASAMCLRRTCLMAGTLECSSRKRNGHCYAPIFSIRPET